MPARQHRHASADLEPLVRASVYVMPISGCTRSPYTTSLSHSESTPADSSRSIAAASPSGVAYGPRLMPIRTFMTQSDHIAGPRGHPAAVHRRATSAKPDPLLMYLDIKTHLEAA